jgi:phenylacetate-CoA ligase
MLNPFKKLAIAVARTRLASRKIGESSPHPLQEWEQAKIAKAAKDSREFRRIIGRKSVSEIDRSDMEQYHLFRFRAQMRYVDENSTFYRKRFADLKLRPEHIKEKGDLRKLPPTDPEELAADPFGFLCVSQTKVMRAFSTSGTSGQRKRLFYTRNDVLNVVDSIAAALKDAGLKEGETLQIMFPAVTAWDPSLMLEGACTVAGLSATVCSTADPAEQIRNMRERRVKMIIGLTSFIYRITMLAKEKEDLRAFGIKAIVCSSEPLPEAMRREIESAWGCKALSQYGMTEMGLATTIECAAQDGLHINEVDYMAEVIDPATGEHLPDRKEGELLWTSLNTEGSPLLRYRSCDISAYIHPPCGCGYLVVGKIAKPRGRLDAVTKLAYGEKIYPMLFDEAVLSVPGVLNYQVIITRPSYKDVLDVQAECIDPSPTTGEAIIKALSALDEIASGLSNDLVEIKVELKPAQEGFVPKTKRIIDNRKLFV